MPKGKTTFIGKAFHKKESPEDPRKVLSLDKGERRDDGTWKYIRAVAIEYEDGTKLNLPERLTLKENPGEGAAFNLYFTVFPDDGGGGDDPIPF